MRLQSHVESFFTLLTVLQCLMNSRWSCRGVIWALNYIQRRLDEILESHQQSVAADKSRSMSMPLPIIEVCNMVMINALLVMPLW